MNFQQLFATLSIPSLEIVCSRGKSSVIVEALMMSWSRGRSRIILSLQRLGLCFSMKKWKGLRPGFQNYLYFLKKGKSVHFFILRQRPSLCRERMIRDLPLDHDIMSASTITEFFPREHTISKLGIDSVAKSC